jgi:hypothetical protein
VSVGAQESLIGKVGRVTVSIPPDGPMVGQGLSILDTLKKSAAVTASGASPSPVSAAPDGYDRADAT